MTDIDQAAQILWDYMQMHQSPKKCDAILLLGNRDNRTGEYAAKLFSEGYGDWLIISGGRGRVVWPDAETEAEHFANIAVKAGVPKEKLLLEDRATNTGENIKFTYDLLQRKKLAISSMLLIQKPYMERRTYATFKKQWPDSSVDICVSSPPISYDEYFNDQNSKEDVLHVIVGDVQRIAEYPKQGFQIPQSVPDEVWQAWRFLVEQGYDKHLIT